MYFATRRKKCEFVLGTFVSKLLRRIKYKFILLSWTKMNLVKEKYFCFTEKIVDINAKRKNLHPLHFSFHLRNHSPRSTLAVVILTY